MEKSAVDLYKSVICVDVVLLNKEKARKEFPFWWNYTRQTHIFML